jgi:hypothetical protein
MAVFDASTCVTFAPALRAASVAPPVYPKRFITETSSLFFLIIFSIHFQFSLCSGKIPTCLNVDSFKTNDNPSKFIFQDSGIFFLFHFFSKVAFDLFQNS